MKTSIWGVVAAGCVLGAAADGAAGAPACSFDVTLEVLPSPAGADQAYLSGVAALGADEIWVAGHWRDLDEDQQYSLAYRWDGTAWTLVETPSPRNVLGDAKVSVYAMAARDSEHVYAVGAYTNQVALSPDTFLMEWDGSSWSHVVTPGQSNFSAGGYLFQAAHVDERGDLWMGGQFPNPPAGPALATLVRPSGGGFDVFSGLLVNNGAHRIRDIDSGGGATWAAGAAGGSASAWGRSYALRWTGSSWVDRSPPQMALNEGLLCIVTLADDDVWVAGSFPTYPGGGVVSVPLFWHWDGSSWTRFEAPGFAQDMVALASDDIYALNSEGLLHWDGSEWTVAATLPADIAAQFVSPLKLDDVGPCSLIAAGSSGVSDERYATVLRFQSACVGDLSGDRLVTFEDLNMVLSEYGQVGEAMSGDANDDGVVDFTDLNIVLGAYGSGC